MEWMPLRVDSELSRVLGIRTGEVELCQPDPTELPSARVVLPQPATAKAAVLLRVHSLAGIPLASARIEVRPGDRLFESPRMSLVAMEGYAHLRQPERRLVEQRVWSRRAYVTASTV